MTEGEQAMAWVRIDDRMVEHPKYEHAGALKPFIVALQVEALSWCNRNDTDGVMPDAVVQRLAAQVAGKDRDPAVLLDYMLTEQIWEPGPGKRLADWYVHDYPEFQILHEQRQAHRARAAERMRQSRARAVAMQQGNGSPPEEKRYEARYVATPGPGTGPGNGTTTTAETEQNPDENDSVVFYHRLTGRFPRPNVIDWLNRLTQAHGDTWVSEEMAAAYREDPDVLTLLGRTDDRCKARRYRVDKAAAKPPPQPKEPDREPTEEERQRAAAKRAEIRAWIEGGFKGEPPTSTKGVDDGGATQPA